MDVPPEKNFYFYRWAGVGHHLSGYGRGLTEGKNEYVHFDQEIRRGIEAGTIPAGDIELRPHWKYDYEQQAREFLQKSA